MRSAFAWLGGVLFVASLGAFVVTYGITLGMPAAATAGSPWAAVLADVALFSVFALHHSVMARTGAKAWLTRRVPRELERSVYVWIASLLFLAGACSGSPCPGRCGAPTSAPSGCAARCSCSGAGSPCGRPACSIVLELAGIRQVIGRPSAVPLSAEGPFGLVRHPIYLGWLLIVFGTPEMTMGRLVFAVTSSAYLVLAIPWEERSLVESFGETYRAYQRQVRWRLIPGVW